GGLRELGVDVEEVAGRRVSGPGEVVALVVEVADADVGAGSDDEAVGPAGRRDELPHPLRDAPPRLGADGAGVEVALLHREVEELRRQAVVLHRADDGAGVAVLLGRAEGVFEPARALPLPDDALDLAHEPGGHRELALVEDPRDAVDLALLGRELPVEAELLDVALVELGLAPAAVLDPGELR